MGSLDGYSEWKRSRRCGGGNSPDLCPQSPLCVSPKHLWALCHPHPHLQSKHSSPCSTGAPLSPLSPSPGSLGRDRHVPHSSCSNRLSCWGKEGRKEGDSSLTSPIPAGAELFPVQDWFFQPEGKPRALLVQCRAVLTPSGKQWRWNILLLLLCCPKGWERNWEKPGVLPSGRELS